MNSIRLSLLLVMTALGCADDGNPVIVGPTAESVPNAQQALDQAFSDAGRIVFRAWDGRWIGTDCDWDIELRPGGQARMTEYGDGVQTYHGTYALGAGSDTKLSLKDCPYDWPAMVLQKDGATLLLAPAHASAGFEFGTRGGAVLPADVDSFWPFRQIRKEDS